MNKFIFLCVLLAWPGFAVAEITTPYTVDEKDQVLFGDSAEITSTASTTYKGLENYTTNYVNDYLHVTFTYTHHVLTFASYPPRLYITVEDPQATSTPTIRDQQEIYTLLSGTHPTDWYGYDVQFDATGYTVVVMQATTTEIANFHRDISGLATNDWAALANAYPKQDPVNENSMSFTPVPIYQAPVVTVATTTPVIIVPGIISSKLFNGEEEKWPNALLMAVPGPDVFLNDLILNESGEDISSTSASSIIRNIGDDYDFFSGLFSQLLSKEYTEDEDAFEFPYDWRLDLEDSALELNKKIEETKTERGVEKVDLVAHSMGGLLVKKYLKDYGGDSVNKFIDVGTPHTGAPKAFKILNYGDNLDVSFFRGLLGLDSDRVKIISQNMPAVYQLLPSQDYLNDVEYYITDLTNGTSRYDYAQTKDYLSSQGRNSALVDRADEFHQEIDNLNPADYGVETYNFVGCGTPTIGNFYILQDGEHPIYNIRMINGDGTVPLKSAEALTASTTYYVKSAEHAVMPSTTGVKELITEILTATTTGSYDISDYSNLATNASGCSMPDGNLVSMHSPIDLHIYDSSGNHAGPNSDGDIENEIPGVTYEVIDDNKFAFLPNGVEYTIKGNATAAGSFDVRIQEMVNGEVVTTTIFADIPLTLTTQAQFTLGAAMPAQIALDSDNDGIFESNQGVSTTTTGILESTGKPIVVSVQNNNASASGSSKAQPIRVVEVATSTQEVVLADLILTPEAVEETVIEITLPQATEEVPETIAPSEETGYENAAVVYKSFGHKVTSFFKGLWSWFKSKL